MDIRLGAVFAAVPCLCLVTGHAEAQDRRTSSAPATPPLMVQHVPASASDGNDHRLELQSWEQAQSRSAGLLRSWSGPGGAELGVGRYRIGTIASPRTNTERVRMMDVENRAIAGAGVRLRF